MCVDLADSLIIKKKILGDMKWQWARLPTMQIRPRGRVQKILRNRSGTRLELLDMACGNTAAFDVAFEFMYSYIVQHER